MSSAGHCLCGAVRIEVEHLAGTLSACHCEMCRRWSGSMMMGIDGRGVTVTGPVRTYASSPFAERAWCGECGSALWIRNTPGKGDVYELMPGLFENAGGARLNREVYADRAPDGYALAGDHLRVTAAEYEADHPHVGYGEPR
jgi:hypothetical protein